jgi:hypothetical protein
MREFVFGNDRNDDEISEIGEKLNARAVLLILSVV